MPNALTSLHVDDCATHPGIRHPLAKFTPASAACRLLEYGLENDAAERQALPAASAGTSSFSDKNPKSVLPVAAE